MKRNNADNRIISMAEHAIGMDNKSTFKKYNKEYFISYRNYYGVGPEGDPDWEDLVNHGLATADKRNTGVSYHLTPVGFMWLQDETGVFIFYEENLSEKRYELDEYDIEQINHIWKFIKDNFIYAWHQTEKLDVEILLDPYDLDEFLKEFAPDCEDYIPAKINSYGIAIEFSDLLDFEVSGEQIWELRPEEGMREEL